MTIPAATLFPRTGDDQTIYLKPAITNPNIQVGDFTMYNDFVHDPRDFQRNNVLYHYPINGDKLLHRLRGEVPVHQRQPHPPFPVHLPLPSVL